MRGLSFFEVWDMQEPPLGSGRDDKDIMQVSGFTVLMPVTNINRSGSLAEIC
jgi:hypothetical protein